MEQNGRRKILVVDDEAGFTRLLKLNLEKNGAYSVQVENHAAKALAAAKMFRPDLILLDVVMPGIDGGEVARKIRSDPRLSGTPIVFLTALVSESHGIPEIEGDFPFLRKPASVSEIIAGIEGMFSPAPAAPTESAAPVES